VYSKLSGNKLRCLLQHAYLLIYLTLQLAVSWSDHDNRLAPSSLNIRATEVRRANGPSTQDPGVTVLSLEEVVAIEPIPG
jgi:hypothetical protein